MGGDLEPESKHGFQNHEPVKWDWSTPLSFKRDASSNPSPAQSFQVEHYHKNNPVDYQTALDIGQLFRKHYGRAYNIPAIRRPKNLVKEVSSGKSELIVIRDHQGRVVGHGAVLNLSDRSAKLCRHIVSKHARGLGLSSVIKRRSLDIVAAKQIQGEIDVAVIQGVTSHPITQTNYLKEGFRPTGLYDRKYSDFFSKGYRESVVRLEQVLDPKLLEERKVYLPSVLKDAAEHVYQTLGGKRAIEIVPGGTPPGRKERAVEVDESERQGFSALSLTFGNLRPPKNISLDLMKSYSPDVKHVSARVNISEENAIDQLNTLRASGFYFAAVEVRKDADYLVMQKPLHDSVAPYFRNVQYLEGQEAKKLLALTLKT